MGTLKKFDRFNERFSTGIEWVGVVAFVSMMLLTTVDVIGSKLFLAPVPGSLDLMMLAQLTAISFGLGASYVVNRHVEVEFFMPLLPRMTRRIAGCIVQFLVLSLFIIMTWQIFVYGADLRTYGEVSPTIRFPLHPFAFGAGIAFIPATFVALARFLHSLAEVFKR
ncbi:MAG: TRAP transporter small permease [Desulfobacterales bacterium]